MAYLGILRFSETSMKIGHVFQLSWKENKHPIEQKIPVMEKE
jgi:hypothetical protein